MKNLKKLLLYVTILNLVFITLCKSYPHQILETSGIFLPYISPDSKNDNSSHLKIQEKTNTIGIVHSTKYIKLNSIDEEVDEIIDYSRKIALMNGGKKISGEFSIINKSKNFATVFFEARVYK